MTTCIQSGSFNDPDTWDSGIPSSINLFVIGAGFIVNVPSGYTAVSHGTILGASDISRGKLLVDFGGTFQQSGIVTLDAYQELEVKGSWDFNGFDVVFTSALNARNLVKFTGTATERAQVYSSIAGVGDMVGETSATATYCDFVDCGLITLGSCWTAGTFYFDYVSFTRCDVFRLGGYHNSTGDYYINHLDVRDSISTTTSVGYFTRARGSDGSETGGGLLSISNITVEKGTATAVYLRLELDYVGLTGSTVMSGIGFESVLGLASVENNVLMYNPPAGLDSGGCLSKDNWYVYTDTSNPHLVFDSTDSYTNFVMENTNVSASDGGDGWNLSKYKDQSVTGFLYLDSTGGVLANALGDNKPYTYTYEHNTIVNLGIFPVYGHLFRTENLGSVTGIFNVNANLVVNLGANTNRAINVEAASDDEITELKSNNFYGYGANTYYGVTSATKTVGVTVGYGDTDTTLDPMFFDATRNFAAFGTQIGTASTAAAVIAHMLKLNGYDSATESQVDGTAVTTTVTDITSWVRDGYRVQQPLLENAGYDGLTVGAAGYLAGGESGGGGVPKTKFRRFPWQSWNPL